MAKFKLKKEKNFIAFIFSTLFPNNVENIEKKLNLLLFIPLQDVEFRYILGMKKAKLLFVLLMNANILTQYSFQVLF